MDFQLTSEQEQLRSSIVDFARSELNPGIEKRIASGSFSREDWRKCGSMGLLGLSVGKEFGGSGLNALDTAIAFEALGYSSEDGGLNFSIGAHLFACAMPVQLHGSHALKEQYLPRMCDGSLVATNGMTETGSGSDVATMTTTAFPQGDAFIVTGTKSFATNAPMADVAIIYAATDAGKGMLGGLTAFVAERDTHYELGQTYRKMGLDTSPIGELILNDVNLPAGSIVGEVGGGGAIFNESMEWERVCLAALHVGTMKRLIERTTAYVKDRKIDDRPIGKFQSVSFQLADMALQCETSRLLVLKASAELGSSRSVGKLASMAKLSASENLKKVALTAIQLHGANGYMVDYGLERIARDAISSTIYSGTSEIQKKIIASWL